MSEVKEMKSLVPEHSDYDRLDHLLHDPGASAHLFDLLSNGKGNKADFIRLLDRIIESRAMDKTFKLRGRHD